ncbi:hypothetical protein CDL12_23560 [Handroanthus impetiginosus]|uniref:Uncharacterized protein n=1 Tax=Handroanthus impetiginosus TaxID=429701 RepID=A0A2G9GF47_9LAMI|nr:hypothetical protein CDL12_23560 [Handroanthus impetiginosus]
MSFQAFVSISLWTSKAHLLYLVSLLINLDKFPNIRNLSSTHFTFQTHVPIFPLNFRSSFFMEFLL